MKTFFPSSLHRRHRVRGQQGSLQAYTKGTQERIAEVDYWLDCIGNHSVPTIISRHLRHGNVNDDAMTTVAYLLVTCDLLYQGMIFATKV
jgi:hypothetical protein